MVTRQLIDDFVAQKTLAIVGASRNRQKFGNAILRDLRKKGYRVFAVNPNAQEIEGAPSYPDLKSLPEKVAGAVVVVTPSETVRVIGDAAKAGIPRLWLQQGSDSGEAIAFAAECGISAVYGHCLLMFAEPVAWFHKPHRWLWKWLGKIPQ